MFSRITEQRTRAASGIITAGGEACNSEVGVSLYFLGIDGGGSKTAVAVVDESMKLLGEGRAGPSNHLRVGIEPAREEIEKAVYQALARAGVALDQIEFAYCGIAGADHPKHRQSVVESLESLFQHQQFTVDNDARIALTAGVGFGHGIAVIAGTGSVAFGRNRSGEEARAGGWGPTLGDEGSGYSIARRGLTAIVRSFDGRGPATMMTDIICSHFGMCEPEELPYFVYAPTTHADQIAVYGRVVIEAAMRGDEPAVEILREEATELGRTVVAVARTLEMLEDQFPVACSGGVFAAGDIFLHPLRDEITRHAAGASVGPAMERPVLGAARMAIESARHPRPERAKRVTRKKQPV
jgi:N-acetylmuramic acid 6-phosphate etherase